MSAFSVGSSASIAAVRDNCSSRCRCTVSKARTDAFVPSRMFLSTSIFTVCRKKHTRWNECIGTRFRSISYVSFDFDIYRVPNEEENRPRQSKNDQQSSDKKLRPQSICSHCLSAREPALLVPPLNFQDKLVPRAVHRQQEAWLSRKRFQLLTQAENVIVHGTRRWIILISPYLIEQLFPGHHPTRGFGQILQQFELLRCKCDGLA